MTIKSECSGFVFEHALQARLFLQILSCYWMLMGHLGWDWYLSILTNPNWKLSYNKPGVKWANFWKSARVLNFIDSDLPAKTAPPINHKAHYFIQTPHTPWSNRFNQAASHQSAAPLSRATCVMAWGLWFVETIELLTTTTFWSVLSGFGNKSQIVWEKLFTQRIEGGLVMVLGSLLTLHSTIHLDKWASA